MEERKFVLKPCTICFGLSVLEMGNGNVIDCPNSSCRLGYVQVEIEDEEDSQEPFKIDYS